MRTDSFLIILMYHQIYSDRPADRYSVHLDSFVWQMRLLAREGFSCVVPESLGDAGGGRRVMVTFDDGYSSDYRHALPVLASQGYRGSSFVTTSYVGRNGYLTWEEIGRLSAGGFSVQSHTHTHPLLEGCTPQSLAHELEHSRMLLESHLGTRVTGLSLPGGSMPGGILAAAQRAGYRHVFSSMPGMHALPVDGCQVLRRLRINSRISRDDFARLAAGDVSMFRATAAGYALRGTVKRIIGRNAYHRLWRCFSGKREMSKGGVT